MSGRVQKSGVCTEVLSASAWGRVQESGENAREWGERSYGKWGIELSRIYIVILIVYRALLIR